MLKSIHMIDTKNTFKPFSPSEDVWIMCRRTAGTIFDVAASRRLTAVMLPLDNALCSPQ
jgi:hypothetical protein